MIFSTLSLDLMPFSNIITPKSIISLDLYPTISFSKLATGATALAVLPISSFLQVGATPIYSTTITSFLYAANTRVNLENGSIIDSSNVFNSAMKMIIPGESVTDYSQAYNLVHYMPNCLNNGAYQNALHTSTVTPFFGSTGSVYISII